MPFVLLVDDSPVARRLMAQRLRAEGLLVREEESVASAEAVQGLACAVLDLQLEDGNGVEVARLLREAQPALPIAFFTGAEPAQHTRASAYGPVFEKPDAGPVVAWVLACTGGR